MHLEKRKVHGKTYYCVVEKKRVRGKVKTTKQIYLGSAERIAELLSHPIPKFTSHSYGEFALLLHVAGLTGFTDIVNRHLRKISSVGDYFLLPVINRLLAPRSKAGLKEWYTKSCLPMIWGKNLSLSSQNYEYYLERLTDDKIKAIWKELLLNTKEKLSPKDSSFLFDPTNFFTYIEDHDGNELPKHGHSKQMRNDKNQVCLSLMIGEQSMLPYWFDVYPGNVNDSKHFATVSRELMEASYKKEDVTLVFDKGNNSEENFNALRNYYFVGALPKAKTEVRELLEGPFRSCYKNGKGSEVKVISKEAEVYGIRCKIVVSYNEQLEKKQLHSLEDGITGTWKKFRKLEHHLFRTERAAIRAIIAILPRKQNAFDYEIRKEEEKYAVILKLDEARVAGYRMAAGKNIIFTNRLNWDEERIIRAYRSMHRVEAQFKLLHGALLVPIKPIYHWTDQKIKAHVFLCMSALLFARVLEYVCKGKIEGSFRHVLDFASTIRLALVQRGGQPKLVFEELDAQQQALMEAFSLSRFAGA